MKYAPRNYSALQKQRVSKQLATESSTRNWPGTPRVRIPNNTSIGIFEGASMNACPIDNNQAIGNRVILRKLKTWPQRGAETHSNTIEDRKLGQY